MSEIRLVDERRGPRCTLGATFAGRPLGSMAIFPDQRATPGHVPWWLQRPGLDDRRSRPDAGRRESGGG